MKKFIISCLVYLFPWTGAHAVDACGAIDEGTVWTVADSPVEVICDLQIAGLSVEPGVEVLVAGNYEIVVSGILRALGTEAAPVVFRAAPDNTAGWGGFFFEDALAGSEFRWTEIEDATSSAVHLVRTAPGFDHVTFRNNSATHGGAIRAELLGADLVITNGLFAENFAGVEGGAIHAMGPSGPGDAALVVTQSVFRQNYAGTLNDTRIDTAGGAIAVRGHARIRDSAFTGNEARAYTIYAFGGRYTRGGAIYSADGRTEITSSVFMRNACRMGAHGQTPDASRAYGGALHLASGELLLENSLLTHNELAGGRIPVHRGAGVYVADGTASIVNSTLARNSIHALHVDGGQVDVVNSILFFNNGSGEQISGSAQVTYSNVQNGHSGAGNITTNPVFDALYRVVAPSPAIDAGSPDPAFDDLVPPGQGGNRNDMGITGGPQAAAWNNPVCYRDADGDGFGDAQSFAYQSGCAYGYVPDNQDCDDTDATVFPGSGASCPEPASLTGVCGLIENGTVWTLADSPVDVICDLQIAGLDVEPGVEVLVAGDFEIVVSGIIRALGSGDSPIVFRAAPANTAGWGGFFFEDALAGSEFRWAEIENATSSGAHLVRSTPAFDQVSFRNNSATHGGAIRAEILDADLVITDSSFSGNFADMEGGAIHAAGPSDPGGAALVVTQSLFQRNYAGTTSGTRNDTAGGAIAVRGHARIEGSSFTENEARAYTIFARGGRYTRGGALYTAAGRSEVSTSTFARNACRMGAHGQTPDASRAYGGALHLASGELLLENSLLTNNELAGGRIPVHRGAGVYVGGGSADIVNSTLADNDIQAVHVDAGQVDILNSILFFNNGSGEQIAGPVQVTYSDVQNGISGEGNIATNPVFDPLYRIVPPSAAIDAGNPDPAYDDLFPPGQGGARNDMGFTGGPGAVFTAATDIDVNGQDGPVIVSPGSNVNVSIALDPGIYADTNADWWLFLFYFDQASGNWIPIWNTGFQQLLFDLPPATILDTSTFPAGIFVFYFGVDLDPNSVPEDPLFSDLVVFSVP